jgi:imidazole glycerol-phosphate synthase subunit HisF
MLMSRVIPVLLIRDKGLIKTVKFKEDKYIGDPINTVKIFNEKKVDELIILDIDATFQCREPNYTMIEDIASQCRSPLCYGGGIKSVAVAKRILSLGVEKVAISSEAIKNPDFLKKLVSSIGAQSVVVVIDVKKKFLNGYEIMISNGTEKTGYSPIKFIKKIQNIGVGEIVINSIDNDGMMSGYPFELFDQLKKHINIPMTILGGAGSDSDLKSAISRYGIIGVAAGSHFIYKGKYKAVLINYPENAREM